MQFYNIWMIELTLHRTQRKSSSHLATIEAIYHFFREMETCLSERLGYYQKLGGMGMRLGGMGVRLGGMGVRLGGSEVYGMTVQLILL